MCELKRCLDLPIYPLEYIHGIYTNLSFHNTITPPCTSAGKGLRERKRNFCMGTRLWHFGGALWSVLANVRERSLMRSSSISSQLCLALWTVISHPRPTERGTSCIDMGSLDDRYVQRAHAVSVVLFNWGAAYRI